MKKEDKALFAGLLGGLAMGLFVVLRAAVKPEDAWYYFWAMFTMTILLTLLRLAMALYYAGVRRGERSINEEED